MITHGTVVHPVERARELAAVFRDTVETGPDELWTSFGLGAEDASGRNGLGPPLRAPRAG